MLFDTNVKNNRQHTSATSDASLLIKEEELYTLEIMTGGLQHRMAKELFQKAWIEKALPNLSTAAATEIISEKLQPIYKGLYKEDTLLATLAMQDILQAASGTVR